MNKFLIIAALSLALPTIACDKGDYFGPVERGARAVVHGWDMWETDMVSPYDQPLPGGLSESVPVQGRLNIASEIQKLETIPAKQTHERAKLVYRRYCYHCHGQNGDGRIIVGESFSPALPDLRKAQIQNKSTEILFNNINYGTNRMIPLRHTIAPQDLLLAIEHVRSLKDAPSQPYFKPQLTQPIQ